MNGNNEVYFGLKIKQLRLSSKMNQQQLADYLGIKREMIAYYETGSRNMPIAHIHKVCDLFGVEPINLLDENKEQLQADMAFPKHMPKEDLKAIGQFKKIVKNYLTLRKIFA